MSTKQVIVVRKDLDMKSGKLAAQVAHASISFLTRQITNKKCNILLNDVEWAWLNDSFAKICLRVDSEKDLLDVHELALRAGLSSHLICDSGRTVFKEPTYTCCAIGPDEVSKIDAVTGHLKLYGR